MKHSGKNGARKPIISESANRRLFAKLVSDPEVIRYQAKQRDSLWRAHREMEGVAMESAAKMAAVGLLQDLASDAGLQADATLALDYLTCDLRALSRKLLNSIRNLETAMIAAR